MNRTVFLNVSDLLGDLVINDIKKHLNKFDHFSITMSSYDANADFCKNYIFVLTSAIWEQNIQKWHTSAKSKLLFT